MADRVLIIDDEAEQCALLAEILEGVGYSTETSTDPFRALERAGQVPFGAILLDLGMPEVTGIELCEQLLARCPDVPIVVVTGDTRMTKAIEAMRAGAFDYLTKPVDAQRLEMSVTRATQRFRLLRDLRRLREAGATNPGNVAIPPSSSPTMQRMMRLLERVAASEASVLIQGETGTGKEVAARAIHERSVRAGAPFVAFNCASVPPALLESELFGHTKGAFTDAKTERAGMFVAAQGGTLFLDEVGEMPIDMQAKLLRALQERVIRPVGSDREIPFDARVISATHRNLEQEVKARRFRQDLYYRLNVVGLRVPALRERAEDILPLAHYFLDRFCAQTGRPPVSLSYLVAERLLAHEWPGNVRELENCMERISALARFEQATLDDLPENIRLPGIASVSAAEADEPVIHVDEFRRRHIESVLAKVSGNKSRASALLGVDRRTLYRKLDRYNRRADAEARKHSAGQPGNADVAPPTHGKD